MKVNLGMVCACVLGVYLVYFFMSLSSMGASEPPIDPTKEIKKEQHPKPEAYVAKPTPTPTPSPSPKDAMGSKRAVRDTVVVETKYGKIRWAMLDEYAPLHAERFMRLIDEGLFDGAVFYRGEPGFGLQTGPVSAQGERKASPYGTIPLEYKVLNKRGGINAARWEDPNSASTDLFILLGDAPHLDKNNDSPGYTVFGVVIEGLDHADYMANLPAKQDPGMRMIADPPLITRFAVERNWPVPADKLHLLDVETDPTVPNPADHV